jgi:hypothetical protein
VQVANVIVAPPEVVLPPIPKVTVAPAIEAIQLTPGLAIPVPETVIPAFKLVVLLRVTTFPPATETSVFVILPAQALEVVKGPAAEPVQAVPDVAPAHSNHLAEPMLWTAELKLLEFRAAKASEIGSTTSGAKAASSAHAILRNTGLTFQ